MILRPVGPYGYTIEYKYPNGDGQAFKMTNIFGESDMVYLDLVEVMPGIWKAPTRQWYGEPLYYREIYKVGQQGELF